MEKLPIYKKKHKTRILCFFCENSDKFKVKKTTMVINNQSESIAIEIIIVHNIILVILFQWIKNMHFLRFERERVMCLFYSVVFFMFEGKIVYLM